MLIVCFCFFFSFCFFFFFQAEDGIRDGTVTGVQTCALPIYFSVFLCRVGLHGLGFGRRLEFGAIHILAGIDVGFLLLSLLVTHRGTSPVSLKCSLKFQILLSASLKSWAT